MSTIYILTEGGGPKGLGHVYRAIALANQLKGAWLVTNDSDAAHVIEQAGHAPHRHKWLTETPDVLIRDLIDPTADSTEAKHLVVDIVDEVEEVSPTAQLGFAAIGESAPGIYAGLQYAILRQEFAAQVSRPWERHTLAICLGGVDPSNATMRIAGALYGVARAHGVRVRTLTGPGSQWPPRQDTPVWGSLMQAPLAVVSGGTTLLECAALGVPALVVAHNTREERRVRRLFRDGARWFRYLGKADEVDQDTLITEVNSMLDSPHVLDTMSRAGRQAIDGCGAWRVGAILRRRIASLPAASAAERESSDDEADERDEVESTV